MQGAFFYLLYSLLYSSIVLQFDTTNVTLGCFVRRQTTQPKEKPSSQNEEQPYFREHGDHARHPVISPCDRETRKEHTIKTLKCV